MARAPKEYQDTIQSSGIAYTVDALCEGEIVGLVSGAQGIFIDGIPLENYDGTSDYPVTHAFFNESQHFKTGEDGETQTVFSAPFSNIKIPIELPSSTSIKKGKTVVVNFNTGSYQNIVDILVNIKFDGMYRTWDKDAIKNEASYYTDPWTKSRIKALSKGREAGDTTKTPVKLKIYLQHNFGPYQEVSELLVEHKSSSGFILTKRITPPIDETKPIQYYNIKIERITNNSRNLKVLDKCLVDSVILKMGAKLRYPCTAMCGLKFDAETHPTIPEKKYLVDLLKVKIPNNYTPASYDGRGDRLTDPSYSGMWDGTFTTAWTDNPAWIFYDLITNPRYGLGEFIDESKLDKWSLYSIGRYCDGVDSNGDFVGIDDGNGGVEQLFTANLFLTETDEAYTVVRYLASVFRGITYYMSGLIFPVQDRVKSSTQIFTNANVVNGNFDYSSTEKIRRKSVASVRWNDPKDNYLPKVENVEDPDSILKYGIRPADIAAFACTSRGQANRIGRWMLLTEKLETELVKFKTGLEGVYSRPGDVIEIYDDFRMKQKFGGRIKEVINPNTILLDRIVDMPYSATSYSVSISAPKLNLDPSRTGDYGISNSYEALSFRAPQYESRQVISSESISGNWTQITFTGETITGINNSNIWSLAVTNPSTNEVSGSQAYRILNISEVEKNTQIEITALEYNSGKFNDAEFGFDSTPDINANYSLGSIEPPVGLELSIQTYVNGSQYSKCIQANWTESTGSNVSNYIASGRFSGGDWEETFVNQSSLTGSKYFVTDSGYYEFSVRATQAGGAISAPLTGEIYFDGTSPFGTGPSAVVPLSGINIDNHEIYYPNVFSSKEPILSFPFLPTGGSGFDERFSTTIGVKYSLYNPSGDQILGEQEIPINSTTIIAHSGVAINGDIIAEWPLREFVVQARSFDEFGNHSNTVSLTGYNNAPEYGAQITFPVRTDNSFNYTIIPPKNIFDFSGVNFYVSDNSLQSGSPIATINSLNGKVTHNYGTKDVYTWFEIADNYSSSGLIMQGPFIGYDEVTDISGGGGDTYFINETYPFDMITGSSLSGFIDVTFIPGAIGNITPFNLFDTFVVDSSESYRVYLDVNTTSLSIDSAEIVITTSDLGGIDVTENAPPSTFYALIGFIINGYPYNLAKSSFNPEASIRYRIPKTSVSPGEPAWDYYYTWSWNF